MITAFGSSTVIWSKWAVFKSSIASRRSSMQYDDDGVVYTIFIFDGPLVYACNIWKGIVPSGIVDAGYSQATNDADKADFESTYRAYCNKPIVQTGFNDPRLIHKLGNLTSASASEVLLCARGYAEPASQAQRSVVSTSATDDDGSATGLRQVRLTYLDSNYVLKTEDIFTDGTTGVNTVGTDIRFVESFVGIKGTDAVGAVKLMTTTAGGGSEICGIGAGTQDAFLCHHYVPAGMRAYVMGWEVTINDDVNSKLKGQQRFGGNLVDVVLDLDNNGGITTGVRATALRKLQGVEIGEKTYVRVTVVPGQASSTVIRGTLDLWEDKA